MLQEWQAVEIWKDVLHTHTHTKPMEMLRQISTKHTPTTGQHSHTQAHTRAHTHTHTHTSHLLQELNGSRLNSAEIRLANDYTVKGKG